MSAIAWFEEVNTGLVEEIQNNVKVIDTSGNVVPISPKSVIVRKPEEDFKLEVFPCVSIYNKSYEYDPIRYNSSPLKVGHDIKRKLIEMQDSPVPYKLYYQIDFWSRYQSDMDYMTKTWLHKHFHQFNLNVTDRNYIGSCNCLCIGQITKSDLVLNKERLFHSIVNLEIWVELGSEESYNEHMVITQNIKVNQKGDKNESNTN